MTGCSQLLPLFARWVRVCVVQLLEKDELGAREPLARPPRRLGLGEL